MKQCLWKKNLDLRQDLGACLRAKGLIYEGQPPFTYQSLRFNRRKCAASQPPTSYLWIWYFSMATWLINYWEKVAKNYKNTGIYQNRSLSSYEHHVDNTITFHVDIFNSSEHFRSTTKPTSRTVCLLKLVAWHAGLRHPKHPKETVGSCWHTHTPSPDLFIWNGIQKLLSGQERTSIKVPVLRSESIQYVGIYTVSSWSMTLCP